MPANGNGGLPPAQHVVPSFQRRARLSVCQWRARAGRVLPCLHHERESDAFPRGVHFARLRRDRRARTHFPWQVASLACVKHESVTVVGKLEQLYGRFYRRAGTRRRSNRTPPRWPHCAATCHRYAYFSTAGEDTRIYGFGRGSAVLRRQSTPRTFPRRVTRCWQRLPGSVCPRPRGNVFLGLQRD